MRVCVCFFYGLYILIDKRERTKNRTMWCSYWHNVIDRFKRRKRKQKQSIWLVQEHQSIHMRSDFHFKRKSTHFDVDLTFQGEISLSSFFYVCLELRMFVHDAYRDTDTYIIKYIRIQSQTAQPFVIDRLIEVEKRWSECREYKNKNILCRSQW